ncbi:MAG TPA: DAK2 domain-containing protein, partial [Paludibacteraceae bacterium]|nr:DAK2 domain-containing protein [Paludibacteraceae bacterium]
MIATETKIVNSEIIKEIEEKIENVYSYLNKQKEHVNSLNVFPVPDGDTGLNMVLTIQGAIAALRSNNGYSSMTPGKFLKNFAENMLLNSRGCSGVILSLFAQGFTQVTENNDFSKENIYKAIENGYRNAYEGTENPKEGTMLTIMKALKEKYYELMQTEDDPVAIINNALPYLREVLDKTPDMLPVLKQAGVVDSGGAGFIILLEGINKELNHHNNFNNISVPILLNLGKTTRKLLKKRLSKFKKSPYSPLILNIDTSKIHNLKLREVLQNARNLLSNNFYHKNTLQEQIINDLQQIDESWNPDIKYKFCTEFVLETDVISSKEELKDKLKDYGDSLIIVNSDNKYKVHIHTNKPNDIFSDVSKFGELLFTKVDDMKKQHRNFISDNIIDYERDKSIFCIVSGKGFAEI